MFFKNTTESRSKGDTERFKYVELGAYDGRAESNSRFFDVCLGWEGVLVEPNPSTYTKLLRNRPHAHRLSFAASCSQEDARANKTVAFHALPFANAAQAGVKSNYDARNSSTFVPCGPLTPIIQDLLGPHVQFLSLDVENVEHLVLANIDFDKIQIDVMIVENSNHFCNRKCESRDKSREILLKQGYKLFPDIIRKSDLFVHPKSNYVLQPNTPKRRLLGV